ncbi:putative disease resistance protein RGA3 [Benincasa hispida]|nr:putative disease resistance protein RGA3 [Benincasa hispida]
MAEFLWTFAVQEILKKIVKFGAEQIGVAWGLEKEEFQLKKWLLKAETILADINKKKLHHHAVRLWVEDLQDIVYEADDLLDELRYEDLRRTGEQTGKFKKVRDSISPSKNSFLFRLKMANKMKKITAALHKHYCEASPLGLVGEESATEIEVALQQIRETTSILDFEVVGREDEVLEILKLVIDSSNEHDMSMISIVGMGGLGKTTLAKMVFNHDAIKGHFDQTIWVCVSKPFIVMKILEAIFQSLTNSSSGLNSKEALLQRLRKEMQSKKYFLVLDDVWEKENDLWDELNGYLKQIAGKSGNSIMVTTRNVEVATMVKTVSIHHLQTLSDDNCWSLFEKCANASQLPMNSNFKIMKNMLVRKIGGVPLVAKVLGGALKFEGDHYERWMTKVESITRNILKEDEAFVLSILRLSVDSLPLLTLKQCFAYCSNFPQDYNFKKDELIQMWIAQGFIQPQEERENLIMEDIGEEYFNFLLSRSLFQDVDKDENGRIVTFKMHDLIHDIACMVSNHQKKASNPNNWSGKSARTLRALICNNEETPHKIQANINCLRVLVLNSFETNNLSIIMDKLIHLRYLDISKCSVNQLSQESLSSLYNLQTLKFGYIGSDLPKNLRKLVNLRHLEFQKKFDMKQMASHMGNLIHLQTLSEFVVGLGKAYKIEELGPLKNLKGTLIITNLEKVQNKEEAIAAKLVEKKNLRHLILKWFVGLYNRGEYYEDDHVRVLEGLQPHKNLQSLEINGFKGKVFPNNIFVQNLVEVDLYKCERCVMLPMLGQLPNLKKLLIRSMVSVKSIGNEFYGIDSNQLRNSFAFPQLKELHIYGMKKLEQWDESTVVSSNLFGCLKKLHISGCGQLAKLPSGLEGCHSIEYLGIFQCSNLMLNVQNFYNLYHLDINGLKRLPEGLGKLTNLKILRISGQLHNYEFSSFIHLSSQLVELELNDYGSSDNATTTQLPQQLQYLTNLKILRIGGCMQNYEFSSFRHLPTQLVKLELIDDESSDDATTQLPQFQHFTNLNVLVISNFDGIETLPDWLGNLTSLRTLHFFECKNLKELPSREAILHLTKLENLVVFRCPKLLVGEGDQERAKLSHLPGMYVHNIPY